MLNLVEKVLSEQAPSGAFYTTVLHQGRRFQDENGLVTCLVLNELSRLPESRELHSAIRRGLGFVESCASDEGRVFHMHPGGRRPHWLKGSATARADDTALCALTLYHHDLLDRQALVEVVHELEKCRLSVLPESCFPWVRLGSFKTWLDPDLCPNRVDCVVNAHIAGFLKFVGAGSDSGYRAAVETVINGVRQVACSPAQTPLLSPYHPDANALVFAMERAVELGVWEFSEVLPEARQWLKPGRRNAGMIAVGGTENRQTLWFSYGLQVARTLAKHHAQQGQALGFELALGAHA